MAVGGNVIRASPTGLDPRSCQSYELATRTMWSCQRARTVPVIQLIASEAAELVGHGGRRS